MKKYLHGITFIISSLFTISIFAQTAATYPMQLASTNNYVIMQIPQAEFNGWNSTSSYYNADYTHVGPITKELYNNFSDDFDFIIFILDQTPTQHQATGMPYGENVSVSNANKGLGLSIYDNGPLLYGSTGKLKSYLTLWSSSYMQNGPFLHEICHNWANYVVPEYEFSSLGNDYTMCGSGSDRCSASPSNMGHWGVAGCGGQLGGFDQSTLLTNIGGDPTKYYAGILGHDGFGFNANGGNSLPYSSMELYLMGMIPLTSVAPFDAFADITLLSSDFTGAWNGNFYSTSKTTYDNTKILNDFGARVPDSTTSQKDFKALVVLLTTSALNAVPAQTYTDVNSQLTSMGLKGDDGNYLYNFWEATRGIGSINFDYSSSVTTGLIEKSTTGTIVLISSNPVTEGTVSFRLTGAFENSEDITVSITDIAGKQVTASSSYSKTGNNILTTSITGLEAGVYILNVSDTKKGIKSLTKLVIQ